MVGKILAGKVITGIAYSLIGSETARKALTVENIHKVASAVGRTAAATCLSIKGVASKAKVAVQQRKEEL
jgi:hypothetical protein